MVLNIEKYKNIEKDAYGRFKKPVVCKTPMWELKAWTESGYSSLIAIANAQGYKMTQRIDDEQNK